MLRLLTSGRPAATDVTGAIVDLEPGSPLKALAAVAAIIAVAMQLGLARPAREMRTTAEPTLIVVPDDVGTVKRP